ncbi:MAG: FtsX-like permease family protein [Ectobacillus sp.]
MSVNQLMIRNLKKNVKNYYLYVFALIFTVALYFAFVTLQYDPSMDEAKGSIKGAAAIRAASVLLVAIVAIFLLYANNIFMKRRSKEIGLFQLVGMTKSNIFRILTAENFFLYFGSVIIGIGVGFSISRLITMILFKVTKVDAIAALHFSPQALLQTIIVFCAIYVLIMLMNYLFIKRQTILSLFRVKSTTEEKVRRLSLLSMMMGLLGFVFIFVGYYVSSRLFEGDFTTVNELFLAMVFILATVIIGTYLFYKKSVSFLFHVIRKKKDGYLKIHEVLSLSSLMFRMKSNALLLTVITTVSALAIGLLSLSYISYYSAEKTAETMAPSDFVMINSSDAEKFKEVLAQNGISYSENTKGVIQVHANIENILADKLEGMKVDPKNMVLSVVSDQSIDGIDVSPEETLFTGYQDLLQRFMSLKGAGSIEYKGQSEIIRQTYTGLKDDFIVSGYFTGGGLPTAIVDQAIFERLAKDLDPSIQKESSVYIGIDIKDDEKVEKANKLFRGMDFGRGNESQLEISNWQKQNMGLVMFIVGFLGLTFLVTSGCILYFKQMDESEDEKPSYTILRKLGFTQGDLLRGIRARQLFNFGIPLAVGLSHGYFAVQSGWFLFGAELWTPMVIVMALYAGLYSIFGILSVRYYKKVIKEAL